MRRIPYLDNTGPRTSPEQCDTVFLNKALKLVRVKVTIPSELLARARFDLQMWRHTRITAALQAAKPRFVINCTCMKRLPHVREPDDIGSINHEGRVGNHISIVTYRL
jgi:hypothetical protein